MKCDQAIRILKVHQAELHEQYNVKSLALFGSVAREEARPDSDVGLLVEFDRLVGLFAFIGLQLDLQSGSGNALLLEIGLERPSPEGGHSGCLEGS
jgi:hypothetical protein